MTTNRIEPLATLRILKKVDDHKEEVTYYYKDLTKAVNIFCDLIKEQTNFIEISVTFQSNSGLGIYNQMHNVSDSIYIKGNQFKNSYNPFAFLGDYYITKEESYSKIKLSALKTIKEYKKLEKEWSSNQ